MGSTSDVDKWIEQLRRCEHIKESEVCTAFLYLNCDTHGYSQVKALCAKAREILIEEGNVQVSCALFALPSST